MFALGALQQRHASLCLPADSARIASPWIAHPVGNRITEHDSQFEFLLALRILDGVASKFVEILPGDLRVWKDEESRGVPCA